jgi:heme-degrading monooxygenase HmoA
MHGRLTRFTVKRQGEEQEAEAIRKFEENVAKPVREMPGFRGIAVMVDREAEKAITISYWDDKASLDAGDQRSKQVRDASVADSAGAMTVTSIETGEVVSMERAGDPRAGTFARVNTLDAKPEQIDAAIAAYNAEVVPLLKSLPGFRSVVMSVNRDTGRVVVGSVWATEQDRASSEAKVAELRKKTAATAGAPRAEVELFEIIYADIPVGARTER